MISTKQSGLTATAKVALKVLGYWCRAKGSCESKYDLIAERTGLSIYQVGRAVAELKSAGLLIVQQQGQGCPSHYILTDKYWEMPPASTPKKMRKKKRSGSPSVQNLGSPSVQNPLYENEENENTISSNEQKDLVAAALASLSNLQIQNTKAVRQEILRSPKEALVVLGWLAIRLLDKTDPVRRPQGFATAALRDPVGKCGFVRREDGELLPPPNESPGVNQIELNRKRSAQVDAEMDRRRREDAVARSQKQADAAYQTNLAAWWLSLTAFAQSIVAEEMGGQVFAAASQTRKHYAALRCYRDGFLPGSPPPPEKPKKVGEP